MLMSTLDGLTWAIIQISDLDALMLDVIFLSKPRFNEENFYIILMFVSTYPPNMWKSMDLRTKKKLVDYTYSVIMPLRR